MRINVPDSAVTAIVKQIESSSQCSQPHYSTKSSIARDLTMAKRRPGTELNHDNWEDEGEPEEKGSW